MLKRILNKLFPKLPESISNEFRIVKENKYDKVLLEMDTVYYIQKRNNISWSTISKEFNTIQEAQQYYNKVKEYLGNKEITYTYLN